MGLDCCTEGGRDLNKLHMSKCQLIFHLNLNFNLEPWLLLADEETNSMFLFVTPATVPGLMVVNVMQILRFCVTSKIKSVLL